MILELDNWLNSNRNYLVGVALYDKYGDNSVLKGLFRSTQNTWLEGKLLSEIQSIKQKLDLLDKIKPLSPPFKVGKQGKPVNTVSLKQELDKTKQKVEVIERITEEIEDRTDDIEYRTSDLAERIEIIEETRNNKPVETPSVIKSITKKKGELFRDANSLHSLLHKMTKEELKKAAPVIIGNFKEINRIWKIIDSYEATGILPGNLKNEISLKDLTQKLKNLPTYITKLKHQISAASTGDSRIAPDSLIALENKLLEYETELLTLTQIVENDNTIIVKP